MVFVVKSISIMVGIRSFLISMIKKYPRKQKSNVSRKIKIQLIKFFKKYYSNSSRKKYIQMMKNSNIEPT